MSYQISFKQKDGNHRVFSSDTKQLKTVDLIHNKENKFIMLSGKKKGKKNDYNQDEDIDNDLKEDVMLDATDEDLLEYAEKFETWNEELISCKLDYNSCYSDYTAVTRTFNRFCARKYKYHDKIDIVEFRWIEKAPNCGLQFLRDRDITLDCYGYDYKSYYALILSSEYCIPSKKGQEKIIDEIKSVDFVARRPGFYRVKITCDNYEFRKIFAFSKHNVYLDVSLIYAMKHKERFNVKIELIQDGEPNAYIYKLKDMVELQTITKDWYNFTDAIKIKYPKNRLIKHVISSAWGHMNASRKINKTWVEIQEMMANGLKVGEGDDVDYETLNLMRYSETKEYYELLDVKQPIKYNIRLKSWITAYGRNQIGDIALASLENVVRIHTDCVVFDKPMQFEDPNLLSEDKTTGYIKWINGNKYKKMKK